MLLSYNCRYVPAEKAFYISILNGVQDLLQGWRRILGCMCVHVNCLFRLFLNIETSYYYNSWSLFII